MLGLRASSETVPQNEAAGPTSQDRVRGEEEAEHLGLARTDPGDHTNPGNHNRRAVAWGKEVEDRHNTQAKEEVVEDQGTRDTAQGAEHGDHSILEEMDQHLAQRT